MPDVERDLKITVVRNDAQYLAAMRAAFRAEADQLRAASAEARKVAKEKAEAAREAARLVRQAEKAAADQAKAEAKERAAADRAAAKARVEAAREAARQIRQIERAAAASARAEAKERATADRAAAREAAKAAKDAAREGSAAARAEAKERAAAVREGVAAARQAEREAARQARLEAKQRAESVREAEKAIRQAKAEAARQDRAENSQRKADMAALSNVVKAGAAAGVLALHQIESSFQNISRQAMEATLKTIEYRKKLIELASLRGSPGVLGPELAKNLGIMSQTGMNQDEAASMTTAAYAGSSSLLDRPGRAGLVSREEYDKAIVLAGQYRQVMGGDPAAYGEATSMIPLLEGRRMTGDEIGGAMVKYDRLGALSKFRDPGSFFQQLKSVQGYVTSGVMSGTRMAGLTSAMALSGPAEQAATRVEQAINAVSSGLVRDRGMKVAEGFEDAAQTSSKYFADLGITSAMDPIQRLERISDDLIAKRAADPAFNADEYLLTHGVSQQEGRRAIMQFSGSRREWDASFKPEMKATYTADTIRQTFGDASRNEPAIRQGLVDATTQAADVALGTKGAYRDQMRRVAYESLRSQGKTSGEFEEYTAPVGLTDLWNINRIGVGGRNPATLDTEAARLIEEDRKAKGLSPLMFPGQPGAFGLPGLPMSVKDVLTQGGAGTFDMFGPLQFRSPGSTADAYNQVGQALGGTIPGADVVFQQANTALTQAAQKLEKAADRLAPAAPRVVPPAPARVGNPP